MHYMVHDPTPLAVSGIISAPLYRLEQLHGSGTLYVASCALVATSAESCGVCCNVMSGAVPCLQVYDLAFARGTDIFGSVGADGSVRMFDLRSLEHSTIM